MKIFIKIVLIFTLFLAGCATYTVVDEPTYRESDVQVGFYYPSYMWYHGHYGYYGHQRYRVHSVSHSKIEHAHKIHQR
jgi:hypothetical protein